MEVGRTRHTTKRPHRDPQFRRCVAVLRARPMPSAPEAWSVGRSEEQWWTVEPRRHARRGPRGLPRAVDVHVRQGARFRGGRPGRFRSRGPGEAGSIDPAVVDLSLPDRDGRELIGELRAVNPRGVSTPAKESRVLPERRSASPERTDRARACRPENRPRRTATSTHHRWFRAEVLRAADYRVSVRAWGPLHHRTGRPREARPGDFRGFC